MRTIRRLEVPLIALVAVAAALLARPYGNFPLNDDGRYAYAAFNFARTGEFHLGLSLAPSLRAQVVWGGLFVRAFGESFEVLRASTMTLALLTVLLINRLLAQLPIPRSLRVVATLALLFHPVFFLSSFTYMTEVPFVFASVVALYFYLRGIREERVDFILLGGAAAAVSWWVRQTGVLNAAAPFAVLVLFRHHIAGRYRKLIVAAAAPLALFAAIFVIHPEWLSGSQEEFRRNYKVWNEETFRLPQQVELIFHYLLFTAQNSALFFLPLSVAIDWRPLRVPAGRVVAVASALVFAAGMTQLLACGHPMPYSAGRPFCDISPGNVFVNFGLGPLTLADANEYPFQMPFGVRVLFSYAVSFVAALMVAAIFMRGLYAMRNAKADSSLIVPAAQAILGSLALCAAGFYFDRYALDATWPLVLVLPFVVRWDIRAIRALSVAALIVMAAFSILATGEYFAWNRTRWQAFDYYKALGGNMKELDAGSEAFIWNEVVAVTDYRELRKLSFGSWDRHYRVAFAPSPQYRNIRAFPWSSWMGLHRANLYLQEKLDDGKK